MRINQEINIFLAERYIQKHSQGKKYQAGKNESGKTIFAVIFQKREN